ncbi:hypothetical protein VTO73DRAFT_2390 [Trametes versicolor]
MLKDASEWEMDECGVPTDHKLVSVAIANHKVPFIGKGRWVLPAHLLNDEVLKKEMKSLGALLLRSICALTERTESSNPQTLYNEFKANLTEAAKKRAKAKVPKMQRKIDKLKADLDELLNGAEGAAGESDKDRDERTRSAAILQDRLNSLERKRFGYARRDVATKHWAKSETISKYWTRANTTQLTAEVIYMMREPAHEGDTSPAFTNNSKRMAAIAKDFYDTLQNEDPLKEGENHEEYIQEAMEHVETKLSNAQKADLAKRLTASDINDAIDAAALNKAAGLDGIPAEVWKAFLRWQRADEKKGAQAVDMTKALTAVFNDIERFGVVEGSPFTEGWICPIYKKKDKRDIGNYRPITLLNSDYKLMTKAIATKLVEYAPSIIHPDQAGFIPGRRIFDHIKLSKLMIDYAEAEEINGAIVALDQEKAYDKIDHEYLWATMRKFNFPENLIQTIQNLYKRAESCVIVNGVRSALFRIRRGVRQGDPMSCLLFDIAIEPLAATLRASELRGITLPGTPGRLITKLFADDTTVFLHEDDDYAEVDRITSVWCKGSRARFNMEKTELIPLGSPAYRKSLVETRRMKPSTHPIPQTVKIVHDGEAVRTLGAWIGNNTEAATPWNVIINTLEANLEKWNARRPTMHGRKLIVGMEVGSRTQFLAMAQGMPERIENRLRRMISNFMWNGDRHPRIGCETLHAPIRDGGLDVLDMKARNEAMDIMWLRAYLSVGAERAAWASLADALFARASAFTASKVDLSARINAFLQTLDVSARASAGLPEDLKRIAKATKRYGVRPETRMPSAALRLEMPAWYHPGTKPGRCVANTEASRCLRERHHVLTIAHCVRAAARLQQNAEHRDKVHCACRPCQRDRSDYDCPHPHRCATAASKIVLKLNPKWIPTRQGNVDGLTLTNSRKRENRAARIDKKRILFDPTLNQGTPLAMMFRVFTKGDDDVRPALRPRLAYQVGEEETEVYTDGSCTKNGMADARAGCGVWFGDGDARNEGVRLPFEEQSNQAAEIYAVTLAHRKTEPYVALHIVSDSKYVVDGLTLHLPNWERNGWIGVANASLFQEAAASLRMRSAPTTFRWVKGHTGVRGNEEADRLAGKAPPPTLVSFKRIFDIVAGTKLRLPHYAYNAVFRTTLVGDASRTAALLGRTLPTYLYPRNIPSTVALGLRSPPAYARFTLSPKDLTMARW